MDTDPNNTTFREPHAQKPFKQSSSPQISSESYRLRSFDWQTLNFPHLIYHVLLLSSSPVVCSTVFFCALNVLVFGNEQPRKLKSELSGYALVSRYMPFILLSAHVIDSMWERKKLIPIEAAINIKIAYKPSQHWLIRVKVRRQMYVSLVVVRYS